MQIGTTHKETTEMTQKWMEEQKFLTNYIAIPLGY